VNLVRLKKAFDFRQSNAKNQSRVRVPETRHLRPAMSAVNETRFAVSHSDNRQLMRFNRNFQPPFVWFVHKLNQVFRLRQVILAVPEAPTF